MKSLWSILTPATKRALRSAFWYAVSALLTALTALLVDPTVTQWFINHSVPLTVLGVIAAITQGVDKKIRDKRKVA